MKTYDNWLIKGTRNIQYFFFLETAEKIRSSSVSISILGGYLAQYKVHKEKKDALCSLVVDSGYSFTHIVPYYNGKKVMEGLKR